jgi:hypothetical protein
MAILTLKQKINRDKIVSELKSNIPDAFTPYPKELRILRRVGSNFDIAHDLRRRLLLSHDAPSRERCICAWFLSHVMLPIDEEAYVLNAFGCEWATGEMGEIFLRSKVRK